MTNPARGFEHFLAVKLGKTLGELRDMPQAEFLSWSVYYQLEAQAQQLENLKAQQKGARRGR